MADLLLKGGLVVDSSGSRPADVAVSGGLVVQVGPGLEPGPGCLVLDAGGCIVSPGLVDIHTHLREPGGEQAECVETGARAASLGGYTAVVAMPNTEPAIDCAAAVHEVMDLGREATVDVAVAGAITLGRRGEQLAPMAEMAALGVRIFTDDGAGVQDPSLMRHAMEYSTALGVRLAQHCEDSRLAAGGQMNEGEWSSRLGIPGMAREAEEVMAYRDVLLARLTGARVHLMHLSSAGAVEMLRAARASGSTVTAEVTPHHLCLTDAAVAGYDPVFKVNPPLRGASDGEALRLALAEGVIDVVATDHAPHPPEAKERPFDEAPPGTTGLETALGVAVSELACEGGPMSVEGMIAAMSWRPAALAGLSEAHGGPVAAGRPANICVIDPALKWVVDPERFASRSRNSVFAGRQLTGRARHTVYRGEPVVIDGEAQR